MNKDIISAIVKSMDEIVNVRNYTDKPIPKEIENEMLYAFSVAYSSGNAQPWELLIIESDEQYKKVIDSTLDPDLNENSYGAQQWIVKAPLVIIVMIDKKRALARLGEKGYIFSIEDVSFAIQNFRVVAHLHHLKTACVREFDEEKLKDKLGLPWYIEPIAILTAGYGERKKGLPPRFQISDIVKRGVWQ